MFTHTCVHVWIYRIKEVSYMGFFLKPHIAANSSQVKLVITSNTALALRPHVHEP